MHCATHDKATVISKGGSDHEPLPLLDLRRKGRDANNNG